MVEGIIYLYESPSGKYYVGQITTKSIVLNTKDLQSFENFIKESYYGGSDITQEDTP